VARILIQHGRVIDPASGFDQTADVLIDGDRVAAVSASSGELSRAEVDQRIDAEGCIVAPGLIDIHVHLREPDETGHHEETIATGTAAAINGGFTTICCMPNTRPPLDTPERVQFVHDRAREANNCRVFVVACATEGRMGDVLAPIDAMSAIRRDGAQAGAVGFSDDGDVIASAAVMEQALRACKRVDRPFMQHCQEPTLTRGASMNAGEVADRMAQVGWPHVAEEIIIERDIRLNRRIGASYHAQHLSSGESVEIIRRARQDGQRVSGEASPHHLLLTDQACEQLGPIAKMNPPLRTKRDIDQLKQGIAEAVITILATDHAPHPIATKEVEFSKASFGIVGVDCALALYKLALIDDGVIDWPQMIAMMTINPARLVRLDQQGIGTLTVGGPADITVIDPNLEWTIDVNEFASAARSCPFDGWPVKGRAIATIVAGEAKYMSTRRCGAESRGS
jgi:dihydroorotase